MTVSAVSGFNIFVPFHSPIVPPGGRLIWAFVPALVCTLDHFLPVRSVDLGSKKRKVL